MDKVNVVHLHNRVLLSGKAQWHSEIYKQIDRTKKEDNSE